MKSNLIASLFLLVLASAIGWVIWNHANEQSTPVTAAGSSGIVLMDFYADWCPPCRTMKPIVHELSQELSGRLQVIEVNVDQNQDLARQYGVRSIPCFVVTRDGKEVARQAGSMPKEALRQLTGL